MERKNYYLGLDIGTDSIGYAVTDEEYNLLKFHGEPAWGSTIFDAASLCDERRGFRVARRRLDRRQQRVQLIRELFAGEINKVDPRFYIRMDESRLFRDDAGDRFPLFNDEGFTDREYNAKYPTIHHLIFDLMQSDEKHDVRLVYLACAWLVAHRGHFLNNIDKNNLSAIRDFNAVYDSFMSYFRDNEFEEVWGECDREELAKILKTKTGVTGKYKALITLLFGGKKPSNETSDEFRFGRDSLVRLLAGGTVKLKDLFGNDDYSESGSVALGMDDEKLAAIMTEIGDDFELIAAMRRVYDWAVLADIIGDNSCISESKIAVYEQHKKDLKNLKYVIKKYLPEKYNEVFRSTDKDNYVAYSYHTDDGNTSGLKKKNVEDFSKYILGVIKNVSPSEEDAALFEDMKARLETRAFMPKQKTTDNRVIPHQLYWFELNRILEKAAGYLPFLTEKDADGLSVSKKIESVFLFRIPYFVGPLNTHDGKNSWMIRKEAGKIYPWNFEEKVDLEASENEFIRKMTNTCTYLPGEPVLPKDSLLYHRFTVLNEINNIRIHGVKIPVELKQKIYNGLFMKKKKITEKALRDFLISENALSKDDQEALSGIDITVKSDLAPQIAFRKLLESGIITETDAERIIERASFAENKIRLSKWLEREYPQINDDDRKYICNLKISDFGRLSRAFLTGMYGSRVGEETGEAFSIIDMMWNTQNNLMELLSERFTFADTLRGIREEYYSTHPMTLDAKLDEMYISNAVRRPVYRTLDIVRDVTKAFGAPSKIFVEMTRGASDDQKGKRTKTRKQQILELYDRCRNEDVRILRQQLEAMGDYADNRLQGDKLFLYYMQLGKSAYSDTPIELEKLGTKEYDIDHIYPQAFVKDDSIINNKVLVLSSENGAKSDNYPIKDEIRHKMYGRWQYLKDIGLISEEKFKRLTRATPFTPDEKLAFINRQLTETSQSTKAVATLLKERFPETEIVYCKARLVSDFRQEFGIYKSRQFNDLHHAKDAYLNIVTGNVYNMEFTKNFNVSQKYSIKTKTVFTNTLTVGGKTVWEGEKSIAKVKSTVAKNNAHFTKFAFFKRGGLFDQMPVPAAEGLVPLKKDLPTEKYGGYNKAGAMFYIPVRYRAGKKTEIFIMSVELLYGKRFLEDESFAREYCFDRLRHILGKNVDEVSFPMGMRPWKVNTVLSLDGFRVCITGISGGGKSLIAQNIMQFTGNVFWEFYLKKLEKFVEKTSKYSNYIYDEVFDEISAGKNLELYDLYIDKYKNSIFSKRINAPVSILEKGRNVFAGLDIKEQAKTLLNIHQTFGRIAGGCDLSSIGAGAHAGATVNFSASVSNWKKYYSDVRIIDQSASGLREKKSENILELP